MSEPREIRMSFVGELAEKVRRGEKTQSRRVMRPQPSAYVPGPNAHETDLTAPYFDAYCNERKTEANPRGMSDRWCWWSPDQRQGPDWIRCPFGKPGDRLWVPEAHYRYGHWEPVPGKLTPKGRQKWRFVADREGCAFEEPNAYDTSRPTLGDPLSPRWYWRNPRFMPKAFARTWATVTDIRAERLQSITTEDIKAEGVRLPCTEEGAPLLNLSWASAGYYPDTGFGAWTIDDYWRAAWIALWDSLAKPGEKWADDPWVWVVSFEREETSHV